MGQAESNESAAVKRQAEGGAVPMYELLDLSGKIVFIINLQNNDMIKNNNMIQSNTNYCY